MMMFIRESAEKPINTIEDQESILLDEHFRDEAVLKDVDI